MSFCVTSLIHQKSMQKRCRPSFFFMTTVDEHQELYEGSIMPCKHLVHVGIDDGLYGRVARAVALLNRCGISGYMDMVLGSVG